MPLSQDDRIAISKKIVDIPKQNEQATNLQAQLEAAKDVAESEDNSNRSLMDDITPLVNLYQQELERYDGNGRTQLVEQNLQDSARKVNQAPFFPNDNQTPLPSLPDGIWKNFPAFAGNLAIGKNYDESYNSVTREQDLIDAVNAAIAAVEAFVDATRSSGDECGETGTCSMPIYDNETDCTNNGGTWTPGPDFIGPSAAMAAAGNDLINAIQAWEDFLNGTLAVIPTNVQDPDAGREALNDISRNDINNAISIIDTWQALQDYDTTTSTPTNCAAFNTFPASSFDPSKFRADELQPIKDEITARQTYITTRTGELESDTFLGGIVQDGSNGELTSTTGFYGRRMRIIDMRLNLMGGSLNKVISIESGQAAQEELKKSNDNAAATYTSVMTASLFKRPATNNNNIHVLDATGFSVSDSVYVIADEQPEIAATITEIDGDRVVLDTVIPEKYRETESGRLYKVL